MRCVAGCILVLLVTASSSAQEQAQRQFQRLDQDKDGKLSREELPEQLRRNFDRVDTNKDGGISLEEHQAFLNRQPQRPNRNLEGVKLIADQFYADNENPRQSLDILLPEKPTGDQTLPVIVFIHGGGWRNGSKEGGRNRLAPLVATGRFAGVTINYRLTNEAQWPAQGFDCKAAIRWIRGNAEKYNFDPERIGVMGSSAGGHLVAFLGTTGGVEEVEGDLGSHLKQSSNVQCVVDYFGPANFLTMGDFGGRINHNSADSPEGLLLGGAPPERKQVAKQASPSTWVSQDDPPFLIIHGDKDPVVPLDQSQKLHEALEKAGVKSELIIIKGGGHGGFGEQEPTESVRKFLELHLLKKESP